ncbi:MAG: ABC transporter permease [Dehalococcoidia bacterium]|nr:ABC transporter permease [Dehalococcoidia bacterium]
MSVAAREQVASQGLLFRAGVSIRMVRRLAGRKPLGAVAALLLLGLILMAIFANLIAPYDPLAQDPRSVLAAPSRAHFMGTDNLGRDIWSRIIFGSRISLAAGIGAVGIGIFTGTVIGLTSGYAGRGYDLVIQRIMDAWLAFPGLIFILTIIAALGPGLPQTILAIGIGRIPGSSRVLRSQVLSLKERDYVLAARTLGAGNLRIVVRHILPNLMPTVIILSSISMAGAVLAEATLSFLGVGVPPPAPAWGSMLSGNARVYFLSAPWFAIWPGVFISLTVLSWNLGGDALRDILDPRLRGSK